MSSMSYRSADVPTATRKCGVWESECTALKMGLFIMNAVVGAVSSGTVEGGIAEVTLAGTAQPAASLLCCAGALRDLFICLFLLFANSSEHTVRQQDTSFSSLLYYMALCQLFMPGLI